MSQRNAEKSLSSDGNQQQNNMCLRMSENVRMTIESADSILLSCAHSSPPSCRPPRFLPFSSDRLIAHILIPLLRRTHVRQFMYILVAKIGHFQLNQHHCQQNRKLITSNDKWFNYLLHNCLSTRLAITATKHILDIRCQPASFNTISCNLSPRVLLWSLMHSEHMAKRKKYYSNNRYLHNDSNQNSRRISHETMETNNE